jgi:hypothetical protein
VVARELAQLAGSAGSYLALELAANPACAKAQWARAADRPAPQLFTRRAGPAAETTGTIAAFERLPFQSTKHKYFVAEVGHDAPLRARVGQSELRGGLVDMERPRERLVRVHARIAQLREPLQEHVELELLALGGWIVGRRLEMSPLFVFLAVMVCAWMWGVAGAFLAVPLLVII